MNPVQISLPEGVAEGYAAGGVRRFFSLPYAAPMTDENRFREPQPVQPWQGVRDASKPGPGAPQPTAPTLDEIDTEALLGAPLPEGPDYLTLNVYAPDQDGGGRPVMVFIHGGGFVTGNKDIAIYDGAAFARDGMVCVNVNYRLGIEGFLPIPGVPTNLGLRDLIAALQWVRSHIALFAGDPENVTVFGESAGACCTALLMVSPLANTLFRRAIVQSGHVDCSRDLTQARRLTDRIAKRLRIAPSREGFLSCTPGQLLDATTYALKPSPWFTQRDKDGRDPQFGVSCFLPVFGDDVLPVPTLQAVRDGAGRHIDLLIGANSDEANAFLVPGGAREKMNRWIARYFLWRAIPKGGQILEAYGLNDKGARTGHVLSRALTDLMFRWLARRTAEFHQGRAFVYEFEWGSPAIGGELGAAHAIELPFVFDTLACASGERGILGPNPPQALADSIHALWIRFATDGTLPWPAFDGQTRQVYSLTKGVAAFEPIMPAAAFLP